MSEEVITVSQAAKLLHVTEQTVRAGCRRGELPGVHVGRRWLLNAEKLKALLRGEVSSDVAR